MDITCSYNSPHSSGFSLFNRFWNLAAGIWSHSATRTLVRLENHFFRVSTVDVCSQKWAVCNLSWEVTLIQSVFRTVMWDVLDALNTYWIDIMEYVWSHIYFRDDPYYPDAKRSVQTNYTKTYCSQLPLVVSSHVDSLVLLLFFFVVISAAEISASTTTQCS